MIEEATRPLEWTPRRAHLSRLPYLPGLDGMRALAVVAVMVYHADSTWLPGGFLGVEVFFVISGYLITLLLIGEHERTGRVSLGGFWARRARRLLPALFTMMLALVVYTALFRSEALGQLRGDVVAGTLYVSNWYQIWVGQGYTSAGDFAPMRHLWSLGVEEQFYLLWPLVMVGLLRLGRRRLPDIARWVFLGALVAAALTALAYHPGVVGDCATTPDAYYRIGGRCIAKADALYLGTITRAGGVLLGASFAMVWRPVAIMRGPVRRRGAVADLVALLGLAGLGWLMWNLHVVTPDGEADPWLFRCGFLLTGVATLAVMAAVTHRRALTGGLLGNPLLVWIGTRSYGLYLFHWPIYQIIRGVAGTPLTPAEFAMAMVVTFAVSEVSYRFIETPIRRGTWSTWWRRMQRTRDPAPRRLIAAVGASVVAASVFAGVNLATAEVEPNEVQQAIDVGADDVSDVLGQAPIAVPSTTTTSVAAPTASIVPPASTPTSGTAVDPGAGPPASNPRPSRTTVPPSTAPATPPPTTVDADRIDRFAIGDSVMLGAAGDLAALGFTVDAKVSRQMIDTVEAMRWLRSAGVFGDVVVVHLGTNGSFSDETLHAFFDELVDVPKVIVLTIRAPRGWTASNNAKLVALPASYPNVTVLDWATVSNACPGDCFASDDIHLNADGRRYYAEQVRRTLRAG